MGSSTVVPSCDDLLLETSGLLFTEDMELSGVASSPKTLDCTSNLNAFPSEDCFDAILHSMLSNSTIKDNSTLGFQTPVLQGFRWSTEALLSICEILSNSSFINTITSTTSFDSESPRILDGCSLREDTILGSNWMRNPNPKILPCVLRCLRPWRLDIGIDTLSASRSDRSLVDLATKLAALVNTPAEFTTLPGKIPQNLNIGWLGRVDGPEAERANEPMCTDSDTPPPWHLSPSSTSPQSGNISGARLCATEAALFRSGCLACRRPRRPYSNPISDGGPQLIRTFVNSTIHIPKQKTKRSLPPTKSRLSAETHPVQVITKKSSNTRALQKVKVTIPDENIPPLPQLPSSSKSNPQRSQTNYLHHNSTCSSATNKANTLAPHVSLSKLKSYHNLNVHNSPVAVHDPPVLAGSLKSGGPHVRIDCPSILSKPIRTSSKVPERGTTPKGSTPSCTEKASSRVLGRRNLPN